MLPVAAQGWLHAISTLMDLPLSLRRANMEMMLTALHLRQAFEVVVLGEECERAKPFPDPYLVAAEKLGLRPSDPVIVIEDSPSGTCCDSCRCWTQQIGSSTKNVLCVAHSGRPHHCTPVVVSMLGPGRQSEMLRLYHA